MKNRNRQNAFLLTIILFLVVIDLFLLYKLNQTKREKEPEKVEENSIVEERAVEEEKIIPENLIEEYEEEQEEIKPRIAIVIDDLGYNLKRGERLLALDFPFTVSILPNLPYSRNLSEKAHDCGKEVILHLPMEPYNSENRALEKDTLLVSMSNAKIIELFERDLSDVIGAVGVNNHQGSKMIENEEKMEVILKELKKRGLFFWTVEPLQRELLKRLPGNMA